MNRFFQFSTIAIVSLVTLFFGSCKEFEAPDEITAPAEEISESPILTNVIPADSAMAGVREITLEGQNFVDNISDTLLVYLGGEKVNIKEASENSIVFYRPNTSGKDLGISVVKSRALGVSKLPAYGIENPISEYGDFSREAFKLTDIEVDNNEVMYIATRRRVLRLAADGINIDTLADLSSAFSKITDIKIGPEGYLYTAVSKGELYKINLTTGESEEHFDFSKKVDFFDFDNNLNIYVGRRDGIYVLTTDLQENFTGLYDDEAIKEIRYFNGYLYVATAKVLSRNMVLDENGSLGEKEVLFDLSTYSEYASTDLSSFTIDIDGSILFCLSGHSSQSVFTLENDFSIEPFYKEEIIPLRVDQVIFGSGRYIYLSRGQSIVPITESDEPKIYKMGFDKIGAPYYGRN